MCPAYARPCTTYAVVEVVRDVNIHGVGAVVVLFHHEGLHCVVGFIPGIDDDDDGEMVTVPYDEGVIDLAWHIYEMAALEIPIRHVHPEGQCVGESDAELWDGGQSERKEIDPRWDKLRKILDNNNK